MIKTDREMHRSYDERNEYIFGGNDDLTVGVVVRFIIVILCALALFVGVIRFCVS